MVCMQNKNAVKGSLKHGVGLVLLAGRGKHHMHEVARIRELVLRIHVGLANGVLVGHGSQRGHLGNQPHKRNVLLLRRINVEAIGVEGRHTATKAGQNSHGVGVTSKAPYSKLHLLMHHGVVHHERLELGILGGCGKLAVVNEVTGFKKVTVHRQLLYGIATI
nr:hypothetical protein NCPCFENI_00446 [Cupriavidus sp.]